MEALRRLALVALLALISATKLLAQDGTCGKMDLGPEADLHGFVPFPAR